MQRTCILTDNSVQFIQAAFMGQDLVKVLPFSHNESKKIINDQKYPASFSFQELVLRDFLAALILEFENILIITLSGTLSVLPVYLQNILDFLGKPGNIKLFNSRTTSIGLGVLVEKAAELASIGVSFGEIDSLLRRSIPSIYTLLYLPDLEILAKANYLSLSQAVVGDMLEIQPVFSLENECFTPIRKVHSTRQVLEIFQEFLDEFTEPYFAALVKANKQSPVILKNGMNSSGSESRYRNIPMVSSLKDLLGPNAVGLFVAEGESA